MHHGVDAVGGQPGVHKLTQPADAQRQQVLKRRADHVKGQPEDQQHHADENGNGKIFVRQDAVDAHAAQVLLAFLTFYDGFRAEALNIIVAHGGNGRVAVEFSLVLHLYDAVLQHFPFVLVQFQPSDDVLVALDDLGRGEAPGDPGSLRVILDQVGNGVDAAVHRAFVAEVHALRHAVLLDGLHGHANQLVNALVLRGRDRDDVDAEFLAHGGDSDTQAAIAGSIAEAAYGIPDWIKEKAYSYLDEPLKDVISRWNEYIALYNKPAASAE